jgi:hypothetical protein
VLQREFELEEKTWGEIWGIFWKGVVVRHLVPEDKSLKEFLLNVWAALCVNQSYRFVLSML